MKMKWDVSWDILRERVREIKSKTRVFAHKCKCEGERPSCGISGQKFLQLPKEYNREESPPEENEDICINISIDAAYHKDIEGSKIFRDQY